MRYLSKFGLGFCFKNTDINEILESDVEISEEIYEKFKQEELQGKRFKLRDINGSTFEEIFEEIIPETIEPGAIEPSPQELLTQQIANLAIENKKKDVAIQGLVKMVADLNIKVQGGTN